MKRSYVIGCGKLGASIANDLSRRELEVIIIDNDESSFAMLDDDFSGDPKVADATDLDALVNLGIETAGEVYITTGNDNLSLFLAHACAIEFKIPYVYVRFDDPTLGILVQGQSNIKAVYPFQLTRDRLNLIKSGGEES